jgi:hypothetical protein
VLIAFQTVKAFIWRNYYEILEEIRRLSALYRQSILGHINRLVAEISNPPNIRRRFRRQWPSDLPQPADDENVSVSSMDDLSTQDTYLEQIYLLLHIIESKL